MLQVALVRRQHLFHPSLFASLRIQVSARSSSSGRVAAEAAMLQEQLRENDTKYAIVPHFSSVSPEVIQHRSY